MSEYGIKYCEMFHSIQGEGRTIGKNVVFLRLSGCNLKCTYCDSKYSWSDGKFIQMSDIIDYIKSTKANGLVITGGEPLLQLEAIKCLLVDISNEIGKDFHIEIETNGTIKIGIYDNYLFSNVYFNVSPKLKNSDCFYKLDDVRVNLIHFNNYFKNSIFKFVVSSKDDIDEINILCEGFNENRIYLMPEGITREVQIKNQIDVIDICKEFGYNFSPRTHILIWDNKKGV